MSLRRFDVVAVSLCVLLGSGAVAAAEPGSESPASSDWYSRSSVSIGGALGAETAFGDLARETNLGPAARLHLGLNPGWFPYLRTELTLGLSRLGRSVEGGESSLLRTPLVASALLFLPTRSLFGEGATSFPVPYLRLGGGGAGAFAGDLSAFDPLFVAGAGLRLPLGALGWSDYWHATFEVTHSTQFEELNGQFLGVTLGLERTLVFDRDGDGLQDNADGCPLEPEDVDGFSDADGCPDTDNDQDGLLDVNDGCPDEPEDKDGYADEDGCVDADNDGDGIADGADTCPAVAEDKDGFEDGDGCLEEDNDKDGLADGSDQCPNDAEDMDGFNDKDGCPESDNDGDGIADASDQCPIQPEDMNGFRDDDGCPDARDDKDKDAIADKLDKCPSDPEDRDAFEDEDGCPEADNDKDGIADAADTCPVAAEDMDSIGDTDGCPEDDYDFDGIADAADKCPLESEIINGTDDADGCPDQGATLVELKAERIEIKEKVYFKTGSDEIDERSFGLLRQIAALLTNHKEVSKIRIEGHTDDVGEDAFNLQLSRQRAEAVRGYLVREGITVDRMEAIGHGEAKPIASNKSKLGREMNRRVEFLVDAVLKPEPKAAPPAPAPPWARA
jgi:OmpA-OmpF porin, OOP family